MPPRTSIFLLAFLAGCASLTNRNRGVEIVGNLEIAGLDRSADSERPRFDVVVYYIDNPKLPWRELREGLRQAREVFRRGGVEMRVVEAKRVTVPPSWLHLGAETPTHAPGPGYAAMGMYARMNVIKDRLSARQLRLFEAVIEPRPRSDRVIYVLTPHSAEINWHARRADNEGWKLHVAKTSAISFPPYMFADRIPKRIRGVITYQQISARARATGDHLKTMAHELGHKLINVSHESQQICPKDEVRGDKGLMIYGPGTEIFKGKPGRWHRERLHLSPFLYRVVNGKKIYNRDFERGGIYDDPIYGDYVIRDRCTLR